MPSIDDLLIPTKNVQFIQGVVSTGATAPSPPQYPFWYCGVKLNGSPNETKGLRFYKDYWPQVNDVVWIAWFGTDGFVMGRLEDGSTELKGDNVAIGGSLTIGSSQMTGDGWFRSSGQTGWYSQTYGCGVYMLGADNYVRAYPDGVGKFYSAIEQRAGSSCIGQYNGSGAWLCVYHSATGGGATNYSLLSDGTNTFLNTGGGALLFRYNNTDLVTMTSSSGTDFRFVLRPPVITGGINLAIAATSNQVGPVSSSRRYKTDIVDYDGGEHNPVWAMRPVRFKWNEENTANGADTNARLPEGQTGLIAEEVHDIAIDAVFIDEDQEPTGLEQNALIAYLIDAVQYLKTENETLKARVAALETKEAA